MCGRYQVMDEETNIEIKKVIDEINRRYYGTDEVKNMTKGEVFPSDVAPVIAAESPMPMRWGFPPVRGKARAVINARQETAASSPYFSSALQKRRIVVPTSGFYEWGHNTKGKATDKYRFRIQGESTLYLAGIYSPFMIEGNRVENRYAILTTSANDDMRKTCNHDRMPVCLSASELEAWLFDPHFTGEVLSRNQPSLAVEMARNPNQTAHEQLNMF